jgi:hypothetical protein
MPFSPLHFYIYLQTSSNSLLFCDRFHLFSSSSLIFTFLPSFFILHVKIVLGPFSVPFIPLFPSNLSPAFLSHFFRFSILFVSLLILAMSGDIPSLCHHNSKRYFMLSSALWVSRESDRNLPFPSFKRSSCLFVNRDEQSSHLKYFAFYCGSHFMRVTRRFI